MNRTIMHRLKQKILELLLSCESQCWRNELSSGECSAIIVICFG